MIDQARLDELAQDFGEEDLAEIIEVFLAETWEAIDALKDRVDTLSPDDQRDQFHFLKGCARNIGASQFGDYCEKWEKVTQPFQSSDYAQLRAEFDKVCDHLSGRGLRMSA